MITFYWHHQPRTEPARAMSYDDATALSLLRLYKGCGGVAYYTHADGTEERLPRRGE